MLLIFEFAGDYVQIKIAGHNILFSTSQTNFQTWTPIDGLVLKKAGIIKQFPDLKDLELGEMRIEAIKRFKEHIKTFDNEFRIKDYLVKELTPQGYILKSVQREGHRPQKIK
jgi:hypothetical protein